MITTENRLAQAMCGFIRRPVQFVRKIIRAEPDVWQEKGLNALVDNHRISIMSGHGVGKAHPKSLIIDTPSGPTHFGNLHVGDLVFGSDGHPTAITGVYDRGIMLVYRVSFDDGSSTLVSEDHLWSVRGRQERHKGLPFKVMSTREIMDAGIYRSNGKNRAKQWEIPLVSNAIEYPYQWVPVDPYTLGAWIGDGGHGTGRITNNDPEVLDRIRAAGYDVRVTPPSDDRHSAITLQVYDLIKGLRHIGIAECHAWDKYIPKKYLYNCPEVRREVLRGMMDTDGYVTPWGTAQICTISKQLAEDIVWLVRSLGGKSRMPKPKRTKGHPAYNVPITLPDGESICYIKRKAERVRLQTQKRYLSRWISSIEYVGREDVRCISVDANDELYVANDLIVTHNTAWEAWVALWFLATRPYCRVIGTAPTFPQLMDVLWPEIGKWLNRSDLRSVFKWTKTRINYIPDPENWFATARTSNKPENLAGFHEKHILFLCDEASGIAEDIYETIEGALTTVGAYQCLCGNPTKNTGTFADSAEKDRALYWFLRVACYESKMVSPLYWERLAKKYGKDSDVYRVRVEGLPPKAEPDVLIPIDLVEAAIGRDIEDSDETIVEMGVDVARFGNDETVLVGRYGYRMVRMEYRHGQDTMITVGMLISMAMQMHEEYHPSFVKVKVDDDGVGGGVVDRAREIVRLKKLPIQIVSCHNGGKPMDPDQFKNWGTESWCHLKVLLQDGKASLMDDDDLVGQLSTRKYTMLSSGQMQLWSKGDMKKKAGITSPDRADATVLAYAETEGVYEMVIPEFAATEHIIEPPKLDRSDPRWIALKPIPGGKFSASWLAVTMAGEMIVYDELVEKTTVSEFCQMVRRKTATDPTVMTLIDPKACVKNGVTGEMWADEFRKQGLSVIQGSKDFRRGIMALREHLAGSRGKQVLKISTDCPETLRQISTWQTGKEEDPEFALMENLWRILVEDPKYQDMDEFDAPLDYPEADIP